MLFFVVWARDGFGQTKFRGVKQNKGRDIAPGPAREGGSCRRRCRRPMLRARVCAGLLGMLNEGRRRRDAPVAQTTLSAMPFAQRAEGG